jgi:hypothetical protein
MAAQDQIKKLNDQIQELNKQLGGKQIKIFDVNELNEAERVVKSLRQELQEATNDISGIASGFKNVVQEMQKTSKPLADAKKSFNALSGLAQKLQNDQVGINKLSKKELISIQDKIKAEKENQKTLYTNLKQKYDANTITDRELAALVEIEGTLANENVLYNDLLTTARKRLAEEEKISDAMGLGGAMIGGLKSALDKLGMGGLVDQLGIKDAEDAMSKVADKVTKGGTETATFGGKVQILKAGIGSLGKSMMKNLTDPLALAKFLGDQLIDAIKGVDSGAGDLAKNLNMSYTEALATRKEFAKQANDSGNIFVTTKGIQESQMAINNALGTSVVLSGENAIAFSEMRDMAGFTNEELIGINNISLATGKSMDDITGEFMAQAKMSAMQNGVLLNEKSLLKDIGKVSAATTLSFGKNPKLIGEAVATAKSLGMEMSKVEGIADSLLDFESSIENELSAELLLNKDLNLEKARQYALNNDMAGVAREIAEQAGSSAEFGKMNRIQQEALAKSVGMNRDSLAETLFIQEQLKGATGDEAEEQERLLQNRIKQVGLAQATAEMEKDGIKGLREQNSQAEKFEAIMMKIKDVFVQLVTPIMEMISPIIDLLIPALAGISFILEPVFTAFRGMSEILTGSFDTLSGWEMVLGGILTVITGITVATKIQAAITAGIAAMNGVIALQKKLQSREDLKGLAFGKSKIIQLAAQAALWALSNPFKALLGLAAAATIGAVAMKYAGDVNSPADGKTQISTKEGGLFELSKNDDIIAAPGASKAMAKAAQGGGNQTQVVQSATDMSATNALLAQLIKKTPEMAPLGMYEIQ